ncbi:MAG: DUF2000 domain-containing protein [Candidatus Dojkabacteria bacterium]|nr:DUF2000 domain-containing protein [Candidatus Dojkabacteria bacterium]
MKDNGPTTHRFVCVLNKKIELGRALNALGHLAVGLHSLYDVTSQFRFQTYIDADGTEHNGISDNPFIVLKAKNSNKLRELRIILKDKGIPFTDYTNTMVEGTYLDQHKQTQGTKEADLEYFGICFIAEHEVAKELTKKFSLYG